MNENEQKAGSVADQKSKIRERYKGINPDELDVIPALPQEDIFAVENEQRVAVYARVSTDVLCNIMNLFKPQTESCHFPVLIIFHQSGCIISRMIPSGSLK